MSSIVTPINLNIVTPNNNKDILNVINALVNRSPAPPPTPGDIPGFNGTLRGKYRLLTNVACLLPGVLTLT
jgi:hypothetical protein